MTSRSAMNHWWGALFASLALGILFWGCSSPVQPSSSITSARLTDQSAKVGAVSQTFWVYANGGVSMGQIRGYLPGAVVTVTQAGYVTSGITSGPHAAVTLAVKAGAATISVRYPGYCYDGTATLPQGTLTLTLKGC